MFRGLRASATRALVSVGHSQAVEMAQQPAVSSAKAEEGGLLVSGKPVDRVFLCVGCMGVSLPCVLEFVSKDSFGFPVAHTVCWLIHLAGRL